MKVFSAPRYKEAGSSGGISGYSTGMASVTSAATSSGDGSGGLGENSSMIGSASFQSLNGIRFGKKVFARTSVFDPRLSSRANRISQRSTSHTEHTESYSESALSESSDNQGGNYRIGRKPVQNEVSNLAKSLRSSSQDGANISTLATKSRSRSSTSGVPSAGNIVRVQSHTIKWDATLQQAIPKAVLVKPSSSWKESNDEILST